MLKDITGRKKRSKQKWSEKSEEKKEEGTLHNPRSADLSSL